MASGRAQRRVNEVSSWSTERTFQLTPSRSVSSPDTGSSLSTTADNPDRTICRNEKNNPGDNLTPTSVAQWRSLCRGSGGALLQSRSKVLFRPPDPAQTGPGDTDLRVWAGSPRTAQGELVQPDLECETCVCPPAVTLT